MTFTESYDRIHKFLREDHGSFKNAEALELREALVYLSAIYGELARKMNLPLIEALQAAYDARN